MANSTGSNRVRYTVDNVLGNRFYQMPKFLFEGEFKALSNDARILYALLKDRHELSIVNNWINEVGEVYLVYTRANMTDILGLCENTIRKAVDQLKKFGLMEEEKLGLNRANRIYLTSASVDIAGPSKYEGPEPQNMRVKNLKICGSRTSNNEGQEPQILSPNDTNNNHTDFNNTDYQSINPEMPFGSIEGIENKLSKSSELEIVNQYRELIAKNIEYLHLKTYTYKNDSLIDNIYDVLVDAVTTKKTTLRVSGEDKPADIVKATLLKLNSAHIEYVISCMRKNTTKATNIEAYLLTALYKAPMTMDAYYTNLVSHDMAKY